MDDQTYRLSKCNKEILKKFVSLYTPYHDFNIEVDRTTKKKMNLIFTNVTSRYEIKESDRPQWTPTKMKVFRASPRHDDVQVAHNNVMGMLNLIRQVMGLSKIAIIK